MIKVVFKLKNVRRAPGEVGKLKGFTDVYNESETPFYVQRNGTVAPWPGPMFITVRFLGVGYCGCVLTDEMCLV